MVKRPVLRLLKKHTAESVAIVVIVRCFDKACAGLSTAVGNIEATSILAASSIGPG